MFDEGQSTTKTHYICQTYVEEPQGKQITLQVGKLFQYTTAADAEYRAEKEVRAQSCVGADAYMVTEDPNSGEVSGPTFLARHGAVPEFDAF